MEAIDRLGRAYMCKTINAVSECIQNVSGDGCSEEKA